MFWKRKTETGPNYLQPDGQMAYRVRVKTTKHQEIVELRISKSGDISSDGNGYWVRKTIVGPKTFDRCELEIRFGPKYSNPVVDVSGGTAIPVTEWE